MPTEQELRQHRCYFTGHRPEKLNASEEEVKAWLSKQITNAYNAGFTTFITGMAMGVDIWSAQLVLQLRATHPDVHLICATPWPGFAARWKEPWKGLYDELWKQADYQKTVSDHYFTAVFQVRNEWMVDHSNRVIAYYNGSAGGTKNTIDYAEKHGVETVIFTDQLQLQ